MTVTEIAPEATSPDAPSARKWGQGTCFYTVTRYRNKQVYQQSVPCKCLDCEECGPLIRQRAYDDAITRYAFEDEIWVTYVRAGQVDRLRKQAGRVDQPIESIPVAQDWNVVISPYRFEGAVQVSAEDTRRIFLEHRISKRQLTKSGRWAPKKVVQKGDAGVTLSKSYVGREAFERVAKRIGTSVQQSRDVLYVWDTKELGPEWFKSALVEEERLIREERRRCIMGQAA